MTMIVRGALWVAGLAAIALAVAGAGCSGRSPRTTTSHDTPTEGSHVVWPGDGPPKVRPLLTRVTRDGGARVRIAGDWRLRDLSGRVLSSGTGLDVPLAHSSTGWRLGSLHVPSAGAELAPRENKDLRVGDRRYPGSLRVSRSVDGGYRVYVTTTMPDYLAGVVTGEIPAAFPREAQRTQAIIARTYTLSRFPQAFRGDPILVSDSGREDQEFHGVPHVAAHRRVAEDAVRSTLGMAVLEGSRPVHTWYHSTCGGRTSPAGPVFGVPPTPALAGVLCGHCTASKYFSWSAEIPAEAVVSAAGLRGSLEDVHVDDFSAGGRATAFSVSAGGRTTRVDAGRFRLTLGPSVLRSTYVSGLRVTATALLVEGNGWGHGVGLCQMGAKGLAEQGAEAEEILSAYYPGSEVVRLW